MASLMLQPPGQHNIMSHASLRRALVALVLLSAAAPLLAACNTTAGAGQDVSATGAAISRGANDVKKGL